MKILSVFIKSDSENKFYNFNKRKHKRGILCLYNLNPIY